MSNKRFHEKFKKDVVDRWSCRSSISDIEKYLFSTYLTNNKLEVIEAGTAAGIFCFYLEDELGFSKINAFDIIPEMIQIAKDKAKKKQSKVDFKQGDAADLKGFESNKFDYLIYLGQVLSMVPKDLFDQSIKEAHRIGKKDATYIFSFLDWNSRWYNPILSFFINFVRLVTGRKVQKYYLPEVKKVDNSFNWLFFRKEQHGILWGKKAKILKKLKDSGFQIQKVYNEEEITNRKGKIFYVICTK
ncbi:hypothetical protein GCM10022291_05480 [Postechiella marina]|uniref:Methyltransferase domain-containing protein n=1 Tax=Postechiella marina TaxID=943941 RepID=A0ABP8C1B5_9FLAO